MTVQVAKKVATCIIRLFATLSLHKLNMW